jgi:hypothetical protein
MARKPLKKTLKARKQGKKPLEKQRLQKGRAEKVSRQKQLRKSQSKGHIPRKCRGPDIESIFLTPQETALWAVTLMVTPGFIESSRHLLPSQTDFDKTGHAGAQ